MFETINCKSYNKIKQSKNPDDVCCCETEEEFHNSGYFTYVINEQEIRIMLLEDRVKELKKCIDIMNTRLRHLYEEFK